MNTPLESPDSFSNSYRLLCSLCQGAHLIDFAIRDAGRFSLQFKLQAKLFWLHFDLDPRTAQWSYSEKKWDTSPWPLWPLSLAFPKRLKEALLTLRGKEVHALFQAGKSGWIRWLFTDEKGTNYFLDLVIKKKEGKLKRTQLQFDHNTSDLIYAQIPVLSRPNDYQKILPLELPIEKLVQSAFKDLHYMDPHQAHEIAVDAIMKADFDRLKNKIEKINRGLQELKTQQNTQETFHQAQLLQSVRHKITPQTDKLEVFDWIKNETVTISLPKGDKHKYIDKLFKKARALLVRIEELQEQKKHFSEQLNELTLQRQRHLNELSLPKFQVPISKKASPPPRKPYRLFLTDNGREILVGRTSHDNMTLSFKIANGNDTWLHIHDYPGSHVVLRGFDPNDHKSLKDAMLLAKHYSGQGKKMKSADITITQAKYLRTIPGAKAGKVALSSFKTKMIFEDSKRLNELLSQKNDE